MLVQSSQLPDYMQYDTLAANRGIARYLTETNGHLSQIKSSLCVNPL